MDKGNLLSIPTIPHAAENILGLLTVKRAPTTGAYTFKLIASKIDTFIKTNKKNKYKNTLIFFIRTSPSTYKCTKLG